MGAESLEWLTDGNVMEGDSRKRNRHQDVISGMSAHYDVIWRHVHRRQSSTLYIAVATGRYQFCGARHRRDRYASRIDAPFCTYNSHLTLPINTIILNANLHQSNMIRKLIITRTWSLCSLQNNETKKDIGLYTICTQFVHVDVHGIRTSITLCNHRVGISLNQQYIHQLLVRTDKNHNLYWIADTCFTLGRQENQKWYFHKWILKTVIFTKRKGTTKKITWKLK